MRTTKAKKPLKRLYSAQGHLISGKPMREHKKACDDIRQLVIKLMDKGYEKVDVQHMLMGAVSFSCTMENLTRNS